MVSIIDYTEAKRCAQIQNQTSSKLAIYVMIECKGRKDHVIIEVMVVENKLSRGGQRNQEGDAIPHNDKFKKN